MPAYQYLQAVPQEDTGQLQGQLERELAECTEVYPTYRNKLRAFMESRGIWHICDLDYPAREEYGKSLEKQISPAACMQYVRVMDLVKLHSIKSQVRTVRERGRPTAEYENGILSLHTIRTRRLRSGSLTHPRRRSWHGTLAGKHRKR